MFKPKAYPIPRAKGGSLTMLDADRAARPAGARSADAGGRKRQAPAQGIGDGDVPAPRSVRGQRHRHRRERHRPEHPARPLQRPLSRVPRSRNRCRHGGHVHADGRERRQGLRHVQRPGLPHGRPRCRQLRGSRCDHRRNRSLRGRRRHDDRGAAWRTWRPAKYYGDRRGRRVETKTSEVAETVRLRRGDVQGQAMTRVAAAVVQAAPVAFDREATLEKVAAPPPRRPRRGASSSSSPRRSCRLSARAGLRRASARARPRAASCSAATGSAVDVPGPAVDALGARARDRRLPGHRRRRARRRHALLHGPVLRPRRRAAGQAPQADADRRRAARLGLRRRLDAARLDTPIGRLGAVICWENYMPLLRMRMYAKGVQLYCAPTADDRETWQPTMRHIALEGRCFVLSRNQFARRADYPADYPASEGGRPGDGHDPRRQLHRRPAGAGPGRAALRRARHPDGRAGPGRDRAGQVRLRRRRPLRPAGRLPAHRQREAAAAGGIELQDRSPAFRGE